MRLMRQTDYALRVLLFLAERSDHHCSISQISRAYGISHSHLTKVVHKLVKAGYLTSVRGRLGGVRLAEPAGQIRLGGIVRLMERDPDVADCDGWSVFGTFSLNAALGAAFAAFFQGLDATSLADVLPEPR
jgi:Rrf2 family nitric oxide-sensitive transcriptional repressor